MPIFTEEEIRFIKDNYAKLGPKICAETCGKKTELVQKLAYSFGIKADPKYSEDQIKFIRENYPIYGAEICAEYCKKRKETIAVYARRNLGLSVLPKNYIEIDQFLDIKDPKIAYFLGLLWADGSIDNRVGYSVNITLAKSDMDKIEWIFDELGVFSKHTDKSRDGWQEKRSFRVCCKNLHAFLKENNYHNKSGGCPRQILSKIPQYLRHYWWRGFNDGDGCFYLNEKNRCYRVLLSSCHGQNWNFVEDLFRELDMTGSIKYKDSINKTTGNRSMESQYLIIRKDDILKFGNYIYQGFDNDKMGFPRKREKFLSMVKFFGENTKKGKDFSHCEVILSNDNGEIIKKFKTMSEAAREFNIGFHSLKHFLYKNNFKKLDNGLTLTKGERTYLARKFSN